MTGAGVGSVVAWRLNENVRLETVKAYTRARDSEERFRSAFENAPIGMVLSDLKPPGRFLQVNRAMCEITGYSAGRARSGKSLRDITHPDDVEENETLFEQPAGRRAVELRGREALRPSRWAGGVGPRQRVARAGLLG